MSSTPQEYNSIFAGVARKAPAKRGLNSILDALKSPPGKSFRRKISRGGAEILPLFGSKDCKPKSGNRPFNSVVTKLTFRSPLHKQGFLRNIPPLNATGSFNDLSPDLQASIVDFIQDHIPTLGALACVSKTLRAVTSKDSRWEKHVRLLQQALFRDNLRTFGMCPMIYSDKVRGVTPLSQRPLKADEFLPWYDEQEHRMDQVEGHTPTTIYREKVPVVVAMRESNRYFLSSNDPWLFQEDVPLRDYYQQLGSLGFWAEIACQCYCFENNQCYACFSVLRFGTEAPGTYCYTCGIDTLANFKKHLFTKVLRRLPNIRLFRTLPPHNKWARAVHRECLDAMQNPNDQIYQAWVRDTYERFG